MRNLILIPSADQIEVSFAESLLSLKTGEQTAIQFAAGSLVYDARNKLAHFAADNDEDFVLWLDSDMVFEPDFLERMMESLGDKDILTALYFSRRPPYKPTLYSDLQYIQDPEGLKVTATVLEHIPDEIFEVAGCGFGGVLMRAEVLKKMAASNMLPFSPLYGLGEDLSFCYRARALGYKIFCDPTIIMGHTSRVVVGGSEYKTRWNSLSKV